ncbi:unnamed protein product [Pylaiella littoralis]
MAVTLKFQSSGMVPGSGAPVKMQGGSLTVGRGPANDLTLPDPDRLLSKNHFVVEDHNGKVVIVDFSTNGTFLNYSEGAFGANADDIEQRRCPCLPERMSWWLRLGRKWKTSKTFSRQPVRGMTWILPARIARLIRLPCWIKVTLRVTS